MPRTIPSRSILVLILSFAFSLLTVAPSSANGPCGQDFDGDHACGIASPSSASGSLVTDNEKDYYVFYARKGTEISVTITDEEAPTCTEEFSCGSASAELLEANGDETFQDASSEPNHGITVPGTFDHTLEVSGTYYLVVSGELGRDGNGNPTSVPYTLGISATPTVQWPPPAAVHDVRRCTYVHIRRHGHLVRLRRCRTVVVPG